MECRIIFTTLSILPLYLLIPFLFNHNATEARLIWIPHMRSSNENQISKVFEPKVTITPVLKRKYMVIIFHAYSKLMYYHDL